MTEREKDLLLATVLMVRQYLQELPDGSVDSLAMSAGEHAIEALAGYGLMDAERHGRIFGRWTTAGIKAWREKQISD